MNDKKELSEERKNEIIQILKANKYLALTILSNSRQFESIFESLMSEHILHKLADLEATDESIYSLMRRSFNYWSRCVALEVRDKLDPNSLPMQMTSEEIKEKLDFVDKLIDYW